MRTKVYSIWLLVIALLAGAWSIPSARNVAAQSGLDAASSCDHASTELVGRSAELPHVKGLIHDICKFQVKLDQVPRNVSEFDKDFVEDSITSNTLELQSLQIALNSATNPEWRGQIQFMIDMHTSDLQMAMAVAKKIGVDTKPNLAHASVYPETPDYDLGKRYENLVEEYLNPLTNAAGRTITLTLTPTGITTDTPTAIPVGPTDTPTALAADTATGVPTDTPTGVAAETATGVPTETPTVVAADTATGVPTDTPTAVSTEGTATGIPTETGTIFPTDTPTAVSPGTSSTFDTVSLDIIEDEHVADVQAELTAERLVKNDELRAFAKHSADVTELHLLLMGDLKHRLVDGYTPPPPEFQADYQNPRKFQP